MPLLLRRLMRGHRGVRFVPCIGDGARYETGSAAANGDCGALGPHASAQRPPKEVIYDNAVLHQVAGPQSRRPKRGRADRLETHPPETTLGSNTFANLETANAV